MKKIRFTIELDFAEGACAQRIHDDVNVHLTEGLRDLLFTYGHDPRSPATMDDLYGALTTEEVDEAAPKEAMYRAALEEVGPTIAHATGAVIEEAFDYADHEVAITYPATCGPTPHTIVTSNRGHFRKHCSDMTDEVWTCVQQALSSGLRPSMADTDGGMVGRVSFLPITKGAAVVRIHNRYEGSSYIAASEDDCRCNLSRFAYIAALEQGDVVTVGRVIAEPVRSAQGGAA